MSKSFILVDTPENGCQSCAFFFYDGEPYAFCSITRMEIDKDEEYERQEQCPLRLLPEFKSLDGKQNAIEDMIKWFVNFGWNRCLNEIEDESENKIK